MVTPNANQHYVSERLLKQFRVPGCPLQCYQIDTGVWKSRATDKTCSSDGYNQLSAFGEVDDTLEQAFTKVESKLPRTLAALERAAKTSMSELSADIYENLCWYCTFIWRISPFAKATAIVNLTEQIHLDFKHGKDTLLRDLGIPKHIINHLWNAHRLGRKIILDPNNCQQLIYRIQFQRLFRLDYSQFFHATEWAVYNSPLELPLSDMALVQFTFKGLQTTYYIMPIGPRLLLRGKLRHDLRRAVAPPRIMGGTLHPQIAEYWRDVICLSPIIQLVSPRIIPDIEFIRARGVAKGIAFPKIVNPKDAISVGLNHSRADLRFRDVSVSEHVKFVHSFIKPPVQQEPMALSA